MVIAHATPCARNTYWFLRFLHRLGPDPHANGLQTVALNGCPDIIALDTGDFAVIGIDYLPILPVLAAMIVAMLLGMFVAERMKLRLPVGLASLIIRLVVTVLAARMVAEIDALRIAGSTPPNLASALRSWLFLIGRGDDAISSQ